MISNRTKSLRKVIASRGASGAGGLNQFGYLNFIQGVNQQDSGGGSTINDFIMVYRSTSPGVTKTYYPVGVQNLSQPEVLKVVVHMAAGVTQVICSPSINLNSFNIYQSPSITVVTVTGSKIQSMLLNYIALTGSTINVSTNSMLVSTNMSLITDVNSLNLDNNTVMTSLSAGLLATVTGDISVIASKLATLSLPSLTTVGGSMLFHSSTSLTSVSLPALTASCGPGLDADFHGCTNLSSFNIPALWPFVDGTTLDLSGCALSSNSIDSILAKARAAGVTATTIDLTGGTNAYLTLQGFDDATFLNGTGNTVTFRLPPIAAPVQTLPTFSSPGNYVLNWATLPYAFSYRVDVASDEAFTVFIVNNQTALSNSYSVVGDAVSGGRYSRIRAVNSAGTSANSNVVEFDSNGAIFAVDSFGSYTAGTDLDGLNGGTNWSAAYRSSVTPAAIDDFETYAAADPLNGLNGGTNWSLAYVSRP